MEVRIFGRSRLKVIAAAVPVCERPPRTLPLECESVARQDERLFRQSRTEPGDPRLLTPDVTNTLEGQQPEDSACSRMNRSCRAGYLPRPIGGIAASLGLVWVRWPG